MRRPLPRPNARVRLLLIHHAGGGASAFRDWAEAFPPEVEVCPVQLPGRENRMREAAFERLPPLVEALAEALERWRDLPYAVFGHSNGAMVGFELARLARRTGAPGPVHLFASGRRAPHLPARQPAIHDLPHDEFVAQLTALGGMPRELLEHRELLELIVPLLRADLALAEGYEFHDEPPLSIPITALTGTADTKLTVADAEAWARHTSGPFRAHAFPGDHFFLFAERARVARVVADELRTLA